MGKSEKELQQTVENPKVKHKTYVDKNGKVWKVTYEAGTENFYDIAARILPRLM